MKISVVTITRNNVRGLRKTVDSVLTQRYPDIEHIIVDGESNDATALYLSALPKSIKVLTRPPRGIYNAINEGISAATGDIVGLLHAGDSFSGTDILDVVAMAMADPAVDYIYGDLHYVSPGGRVTRYYSGDGITISALRRGLTPPHPSLYMRREAIAKIGDYREDFVSSADVEYFMRLFLRKDISGRYLPLDMVAMDNRGLSTQLYYRLIGHLRERLKALSINKLKPSPMIFAAPIVRGIKGLINPNRFR